MPEAQGREVFYFEDADGSSPVGSWLEHLARKKPRAAQRIDAKIDRLERGNLGDCRSVGDGVSELEVDEGPGYRLYVGQHGKVVVLLHANIKGSKSNQQADIKLAQQRWREWKEGG